MDQSEQYHAWVWGGALQSKLKKLSTSQTYFNRTKVVPTLPWFQFLLNLKSKVQCFLVAISDVGLAEASNSPTQHDIVPRACAGTTEEVTHPFTAPAWARFTMEFLWDLGP